MIYIFLIIGFASNWNVHDCRVYNRNFYHNTKKHFCMMVNISTILPPDNSFSHRISNRKANFFYVSTQEATRRDKMISPIGDW